MPPRRPSGPARRLHEAFEASLLLKGLFALAETLSGVLLYLVANESIVTLVRWLTAHEITEDPNDAVAQFFLRAAEALSIQTQNFYAAYLFGHGFLKLAVVLLLARGILWAYPMAVVVLGGFIAYQVHRYLLAPSLGLVLLSLLDAVVIALTLVEYRRLRKPSRGT